MITKTYSATGPSCRVTFEIPAHEAGVHSAALLGEWNDWNPSTHPMEKRDDGSFHLTVELPTGHHFRFRYLLDGHHWLNDSQADGYEPNQYGTHDSLLALEARAVPAIQEAMAAAKAVKKPARAAAVPAPSAKPAKAVAPPAKATPKKASAPPAAKVPAAQAPVVKATTPSKPAKPAAKAPAKAPAAARKPSPPKKG